MAYISRALGELVAKRSTHKVVVIFGSRRVGKTTLLRKLSAHRTTRWYNGDNADDVEALNLRSAGDVNNLLSLAEMIVIDEAQRIPDIGLTLKRLADANELLENPVKLYATGSSSLDLAKGVRESAVGRLIQYQMWPFSVKELAADKGWGWVMENRDRLMVYGMYPAAVTDNEEARETLRDYCEGILFKDIFALSGIRLYSKFDALVRLLAYNIGSEVNYDNLARETGLNKTTVADYITLLEQCFIVKVCPSYSRNLANELKKGKKIYFCDTGIRNAVIGDFTPMSTRSDAGALWENFFFMERQKLHSLQRDYANMYFWRTTGAKQHEIDFLEIVDGKMTAFECKLSENARAKPGDEFLKAYPDCSIQVVTPTMMNRLFD